MILGWIRQGLRSGIVTTAYPRVAEPQPAGARNRLVVDPQSCRPAENGACASACPTGAIVVGEGILRLDIGRCILCARCVDACPRRAISFSSEYEVGVRDRDALVVEIEQR